MIPAAQSSGGLQLLDLIQRLEARVAQLESVLVQRGSTVQLRFGGSHIELSPDTIRIESKKITLRSDVEVRIHSHDILLDSAGKTFIKAESDLVLKGSRIQEN
jgi:hypothetical protein